MKTIERTEYLNRIKNLKDTPDIKVITGIRRSGKSILMQEYIQYLKDNFNDINVIFIDFMDLSFEHLKEYHRFMPMLKNDMWKESRIIFSLMKCRCVQILNWL